MGMRVETLLSVEEYLNTSYSPDKEYRDGVLLERNVGEEAHAWLQGLLILYIGARRRDWKVRMYPELRIKVREKWFPIPDVCIYPEPGFEGRYPTTPPMLWIEILSPDDRMLDVWNKADELVSLGVPYVWIIDPHTLESELRTAAGVMSVPDKTLRLANSPIVIPLVEVMQQ